MKQPKALYLLNFVSMWETFSYYGMRVLLVLFMIQVLRFNDSEAFALYALYTTLVDLCGVAGGIVADRILGLKRSIVLGGWTIFLGHLCLAVPDSDAGFFLGLGLIIAGTGLFRSNVATLIGQYYEENDPRRESGYTLYYTGINIGGFLATVLCGVIGETYGWHAGFSTAAVGMLLGNVALLAGKRLIDGKGARPRPAFSGQKVIEVFLIALAGPAIAFGLFHVEYVLPVVPAIAVGGILYACWQMRNFTSAEKNGIGQLALYVVFLIVFYGCEEQLGSSLVMFAERHVDRETGFGIIPAASLIMFNPLTILVTGPLLSRVLQKLPIRGISMIGISYLLLGAAFCLLYAACRLNEATQVVPLFYVVSGFILLSFGELFIGPTIYAYASEIAPQKHQGLIMGIVTMGYSMASLFGGLISQMMAVTEETSSIDVYAGGFGMIGLLALLTGLGIIAYARKTLLTKKVLT